MERLKRKKSLACHAVCLLLLSTSAQANLILNSSFENNTVGSYATLSGGDSTSIANWTTINSGVEIFTTANAADGQYVVDLNNYIHPTGGIQQTFSTVIGQSYTITFAATTVQASGRDGTGQVDVNIGADSHSYFLENHSTVYNWQNYSFDYIATEISTTLTFSNSTNPFLNFSLIDGVIADSTVVPVPGAAWLFASGILGLIGISKRKKR